MSKRFTDTDKWRDPWFRRLPPHLKLLWQYLCDTCDGAGVWTPDLEAATFYIGAELDPHEACLAFGERVAVLPCGKWHLTKFLAFQYPRGVSANTSPHAAVRTLLAKHGLDGSNVAISATDAPSAARSVPSPKPRPSLVLSATEAHQSLQDTDKDTDTDKDKEQDAPARTHADPEVALAPWVRVEVKDPKRTADNRATLVSLVAEHDLKAVQAAAEAFRHREARKAYPDELIAPLAELARGDAEDDVDPHATAIRQLVAKHGWQRCIEASGIEGRVREDQAIDVLTRHNRPGGERALAKLGGAAASGAA